MMSDTDTYDQNDQIDPAHPDATPRSKPVIDLGDMRVAYGHPRHPKNVCKHKSLIYCTDERRVWCSDCERSLDNFEAFMALVNSHCAMITDANQRLERARKAENIYIHRKAAKAIDLAWGNKMAVGCPHCGRGLLAEDFVTGCRQSSREIELARRRREKGGE